MKKIYVKPSIEEVKIQLSQMVMTSETMNVQGGQRAGEGGWGSIQSIRNDFGEIESED